MCIFANSKTAIVYMSILHEELDLIGQRAKRYTAVFMSIRISISVLVRLTRTRGAMFVLN